MIVLVRHGRTAANAQGRLLGRDDPPLDAVGEQHAKALGAALADLRAPRLVASPLRRTRATADAIGSALAVPYEVDARWIELDYGEWDGASLADLPVETWTRWRADPALRPPGGETLVELGVRVGEAMGELAAGGQDEDVVVVTHVSPIKAAVGWVLGAGDEVAWRMFVGQASITRVRVTGAGLSLVSFNETWHLGGV